MTTSASKARVMVPEALGHHQPLEELLVQQGCELLRYQPGDRESVLAGLADADIYLAIPAQRFVFDADLIARAPRLRAVNSMVIGVETIDVAACTEAGVVVGNGAVAENYLGVAEATVMLMLSLTLDLKAKEQSLRQGRWRLSNTRSALLNGRTVGLIGFGRIGRHVAQRLQGWNVRLLAYDPYVTTAPTGVELVSRDELLRQSDIVSIHVTLTGESRGLLGERELGLMKPTAYLVNTARGGVVDEQALAEALHAGRLAGAAIDTWAEEPMQPDNPLLEVNPHRTILTGHSIAHSAQLPAYIVEAAAENITRELRGALPLHPVNPTVEPRWRERLVQLAASAPGGAT